MNDSYWICVKTRHGEEFKRNQRLQEVGYATYLPIRKTDIRTKRKNRTEISPFFPAYFFVKMDEGLDGTDIHPVKKEAMPVMFGGKIAKIRQIVIDDIVADEQGGIHLTKYQYEKGDPVEVKSGILKDYRAEIVRLTKQEKAIIRELTSGKEFEAKLTDVEPIEP